MPYSRNFALLASGTTASAAPATLTDATLGAAIPMGGAANEVTICVQSTAGSGVMTATLKVWGFQPELGRWFDLGQMNGGSPLEESKADTLSWAQVLQGACAFSRLYIEIVALGGTNTAIKVDGVAVNQAR